MEAVNGMETTDVALLKLIKFELGQPSWWETTGLSSGTPYKSKTYLFKKIQKW